MTGLCPVGSGYANVTPYYGTESLTGTWWGPEGDLYPVWEGGGSAS